MTTTASPAARRGWIEGWDPENKEFWQQQGNRTARRNLAMSVVAEHVGFSVWSIWSVLVLFLSPEIGFDFTVGEKFVLVATPTLVGSVLRLPYSWAVTRFGGRNWTVLSTAVLLVPASLAWYCVQQPETPLWVFLLIAGLTGLGGGNFASSTTNIAEFFPQRHQGWALGLNAGGGNLGVAVVHVVGLLVIATIGRTNPAVVAGTYLPLIVLAAVGAACWMDNIDAVRTSAGTLRAAVREPHTWTLSMLYLGTFGSFIGFSVAFGLVLRNQFDASPLDAAGVTFLGPLLGSLSRPVGGWLADRWGGASVTLWTFVGMAGGTGALLAASTLKSLPTFLVAFTVLFVLTGIGNGSVYKLIPAVFHNQAHNDGADTGSLPGAKKLTGSVVGIAGAVGGLGGVVINLAFLVSYRETGTGDAAFLSFLVYYAVCLAVTWLLYAQAEPAAVRGEPTRA
ncbi:MFS transporter [Allosaccharopolyspora coralli]|uniref:MFS transporter n=1 Tax=Allosaccharopolyspora coralli TaxID=2665642 RepID=A0A5Q3Q9J6_9PSEU|nr:nitrate/nitrite transporter [Allosaccharopolyspora coralli]QGK69874.1 MFS transporter [Allosaccharopolyspora coralli]